MTEEAFKLNVTMRIQQTSPFKQISFGSTCLLRCKFRHTRVFYCHSYLVMRY